MQKHFIRHNHDLALYTAVPLQTILKADVSTCISKTLLIILNIHITKKSIIFANAKPNLDYKCAKQYLQLILNYKKQL